MGYFQVKWISPITSGTKLYVLLSYYTYRSSKTSTHIHSNTSTLFSFSVVCKVFLLLSSEKSCENILSNHSLCLFISCSLWYCLNIIKAEVSNMPCWLSASSCTVNLLCYYSLLLDCENKQNIKNPKPLLNPNIYKRKGSTFFRRLFLCPKQVYCNTNVHWEKETIILHTWSWKRVTLGKMSASTLLQHTLTQFWLSFSLKNTCH